MSGLTFVREDEKRREEKTCADGGASGIFRVPAEWGCKSCDVMDPGRGGGERR